jgi:ParB/RepB/Spo0J family partition protein
MTDQLSLAPEAPVKATNRKIPLRKLVIEDAAGVDMELVRSIYDLGVLEPIVVEAVEDHFLVIDGRRRALAAIQAGLKSIPARVVELDGWLGREVVGLLLNEQRGPNPISELAAINRLQLAGKSESEIARATGMDVATIRKRLRLNELRPEIREAVDRGEIAISVAERVATLPAALQERLCLVYMDTGRLTSVDVAAVRTVRRDEAVSALDPALFEVPEVKLDWRARARELLTQVEALVGDDEAPYPNEFLSAVRDARDWLVLDVA